MAFGNVNKSDNQQHPVGYFFHWAPVEGDTTDLSTSQKVHDNFGYGTWREISGRFLFGRDSTHPVNETGGEFEHTLNVNEIPSTYVKFRLTSESSETSQYSIDVYDDMKYPLGYTKNYRNIDLFKTNGGGQPHNNMPPHLNVYIWQRIA